MIDKQAQTRRVIRHLLWIARQDSYFGTLEIQYQDSTPVYCRRHDGRKIGEIPDLELVELPPELLPALEGERDA